MAVFDDHSTVIMGASGAATGYTIDNSVWFDGSADYLSRTNGGSAGNTNTYSVSFWMKRGAFGSAMNIMYSDASAGADFEVIKFNTDDLEVQFGLSGANKGLQYTSDLFKDPTGWVHIVYVRNSTTQDIYINGVEAAYGTSSPDPASGDASLWTAASQAIHIGANDTPGEYFNGYLAEFIFLDGYAASVTDFGEVDSDTGVWVPVDPTSVVTTNKGTHGFWLDFAVAPGTGNGAGTDVSGNGNHFTETSMTAAQQVTDSPTDDAANDVGNYCTGNSVWPSGPTLADGNLKVTSSTAKGRGTLYADSGKFYFEATYAGTPNGGVRVGWHQANDTTTDLWNSATAWVAQFDTSGSGGYLLYNNGSSQSTSVTPTAGDVFLAAIDIDGGKVWLGYRRSGTSNWWDSTGTARSTDEPGLGTNATWTFTDAGAYGAIFEGNASNSQTLTFDFGQSGFAGSLPSGFKALQTANLSAPTIPDPDEHFQIESVSHDGTSTAFTLGWNADTYDTLFIIKNLDAAEKWYYVDGLRGYDKYVESPSAFNVGSTTDSNVISVSGTTITLGSTLLNNNYVVYCFRAGDAGGSSNNNGTITTTASVNTTSGFSIMTYTGTGVNATVGHGLSSAPTCVQVKSTASTPSGGTWIGYHQKAGNTKSWTWTKNETAPTDSTYWQATTPSSTVVTIGTNSSCNAAETYVMYCWHDVEGFSHFDGYTGNGVVDGPFVASGLKPALDITKGITLSVVRGSHFRDEVRGGPGNPNGKVLQGHAADADTNNTATDFTATGLKIRDSSLIPNDSGGTFAFARWGRPIGGSGAAQARAR